MIPNSVTSSLPKLDSYFNCPAPCDASSFLSPTACADLAIVCFIPVVYLALVPKPVSCPSIPKDALANELYSSSPRLNTFESTFLFLLSFRGFMKEVSNLVFAEADVKKLS